jgi:S-adenosylmethionine-diacylgycerolhomoserine-N-methlytransferase
MSDLAVLWQMTRGMDRRGDHASRLEAFYAGQAEAYDRFRERLLHGRDELLARLPLPPGSVLVELGAGTGRNLEPLAARLPALGAAYLVDLCPSLLAVAGRRCSRPGWQRVAPVHADATTWRPPSPVDVVLCSYSLTMMPDWRAVVDNACAMLKPGGLLAVVDFTVVDAATARLAGIQAQSRLGRWAWRTWFGHDGVHPDPAMLPHLAARCQVEHLAVGLGAVPYLPLRAAYATFLGRPR